MPEKWGGLGASPLDLVAACEELGHHAVPGPVAESLAAVPALLAGLADPGEPPGACGEQAGAARRALDLTVGYALTRVQFGQVIGGFQALRHRLADLHVLVESARSLTRAAASASDTESDQQ